MAFQRRSGQRFTANVWPGFVDAMTALLLVLMFVLSIFMIVQFILSETISDQGVELDELGQQLDGLARALGLEQQRAAGLEDDVSALNAEQERRAARIATLTAQRDDLAGRVTSFEEQVAGLLADRDALRGRVAETEGALARETDARAALDLALAAARDEIDAGVEAARLAAARREALEALVADLRAEGEASRATLAETRDALNEEEAGRLAEAAAAEALRARLRDADAELGAMTLALEDKRREAEETLTLLAATRDLRDDLDARLAQALLDLEGARSDASDLDARLDAARADLATQRTRAADVDDRLAATLAALEALRGEAGETEGALRARIATLEARLEDAGRNVEDAEATRAALERRLEDALTEAGATEATLRDRLSAALAARVLAEEDAESALSEAERQSLLLSQARDELARADATREAGQRETALLNEQIAELRSQLDGLRGLLDVARQSDEAAQVRIDTLGRDLNAALARVASEQKARADLEEAERLRLEEQARQLESYRSEFFGQLRALLSGREGVEVVGDRFVFSSEVLFAPGSAVLQEEGRSQIAQVSGVVLDIASEIPEGIDWVLRVDGHTDDIPLSGLGEYRDNWELSQARALSVVRFMTDTLGVPPFRLAPTGFGEYRPVDPAPTEEARRRNRRIELKLTER